MGGGGVAEQGIHAVGHPFDLLDFTSLNDAKLHDASIGGAEEGIGRRIQRSAFLQADRAVEELGQILEAMQILLFDFIEIDPKDPSVQSKAGHAQIIGQLDAVEPAPPS